MATTQNFDWRKFSSLSKEELSQTKRMFHLCSQSVAAIGRKFLPHSESDENAVLTWVPGFSRLAGKWVKGNKTFRSSISFEDFSIYLVDERVNTISYFELEGATQSSLLIWLEEQIGKLGLDASDLTMNLPYKLPDYEIKSGETFTMNLAMAREFGKYFHNSYVALRDLAQNIESKNASINAWPHHFDQAMSITVKETGDEETNTSILAGMSPGDQEFDEPYLYVSSWPHIDISKMGSLKLGFWHEQEWTGAVMPASTFINAGDQKKIFDKFYTEAVTKISETLTN